MTSSPGSATLATSERSAAGSAPKAKGTGSNAVNAACMAAAFELDATRKLVEAVDREKELLRERAETETKITHLLTELTATQKAETEALRAALKAKDETITAKDSVIAAQDKLVSALKAKQRSPWHRLGDILIGAAAIAVLK